MHLKNGNSVNNMTNNNKNKNKNITNSARCRSDRWRPEFPLVPPSADRTSFSVKAERKTKRKTTREEEEKTNQLANGKKRRYNHVCALVFSDFSSTYCLFHALCTKARGWLSCIFYLCPMYKHLRPLCIPGKCYKNLSVSFLAVSSQ